MDPHPLFMIGALPIPRPTNDGITGIYLGVRPDADISAYPALRMGHDVMDVPWMGNEEAAVNLLEEFPVFACMVPIWPNRPTMLEVAAEHGLTRVCRAILKHNPKSINVWCRFGGGHPIQRAAASLSAECCKLLIDAGSDCTSESVVNACVDSIRSMLYSSAHLDCLWTLIDYGNCPVSKKTADRSEVVRCVLQARKGARRAALIMAGIHRTGSRVIGRYNGRDAAALVGIAVWMTRHQWLDVETDRCKRHRKEHPSMPYGV